MQAAAALRAAVERHLAAAEPAQLEAWGERVLDARTLDEVFAGGS